MDVTTYPLFGVESHIHVGPHRPWDEIGGRYVQYVRVRRSGRSGRAGRFLAVGCVPALYPEVGGHGRAAAKARSSRGTPGPVKMT